MAEAFTATKKMINPRVEIDTSLPFESVKEAVNLFSGNGPWIPRQWRLPLDADHHHNPYSKRDYGVRCEYLHESNTEVPDNNRMEEQAARLERVLIMRERETLNILRELEEAKTLVEGLKVNLMQGNYLSNPSENSADMLSFCPAPPSGSISMDFEKAAINLNKTTIDLAVIRASVESLNKVMRNEKALLESSSEANTPSSADVLSTAEEIRSGHENASSVLSEHQQVNFEADQFKKMVEASRYEIMKAMSEIERTKVSIRMAEMRLNAARKIEEAAKAVEAIAFAERKTLLNDEEITLSFEEYNALSHRARQSDDLCKTKFMDANGAYTEKEAKKYPGAGLKRFDQTTKEAYQKSFLETAFDNGGDVYKREVFEDGFRIERSEYFEMQDTGHSTAKSKFRNSHPSLDRNESTLLRGAESNIAEDKTVPVYRSTISIGDILSRKLILQNDIMVGKHVDARADRRKRSLSQLLREQSGLILQHSKSMKARNTDKHYFAEKKRFGFIRVPIRKHNKKRTQVLNSN